MTRAYCFLRGPQAEFLFHNFHNVFAQTSQLSYLPQHNHLFKFLNQHWVKREITEGKKDIYNVYKLYLVLWEEVVVAATRTSVADITSQ